ncbi:MAG: hypothetical protein L6R37_006108 [Teloschistes peruensis]|nr:MAG: hypothetical protein L6R37_006108 [Teloschistes peruensis]
MLPVLFTFALFAIHGLTTPVNPIKPSGAPKGDGPNDDAPCGTYAACGPPGLHYWNTLQTTLTQANPVDRTDGLAIFKQYYAVQFSRIPYFAGPIIQAEFVSHGFDPKLLDPWETLSRVKPGGAPDPFAAAYHHGFDTKNGLIVAYSNDRNLDTHKKLEYGEILYQTWKVIQARQQGGPLPDLKTIVRQGVTTHETLTVLFTMYRAARLPLGQNTWYKWTETDQPSFFWALLGTDNVHGVLQLLNDHAAEIGKKEITEVWTRWNQPANPDIWIEIRPATWINHLVMTDPGAES